MPIRPLARSVPDSADTSKSVLTKVTLLLALPDALNAPIGAISPRRSKPLTVTLGSPPLSVPFACTAPLKLKDLAANGSSASSLTLLKSPLALYALPVSLASSLTRSPLRLSAALPAP